MCLQRLSDLYYDIHRSYLKVTEVVNSEKRLFGRYYRVAFYGQVRRARAWSRGSDVATVSNELREKSKSFLRFKHEHKRLNVLFFSETFVRSVTVTVNVH